MKIDDYIKIELEAEDVADLFSESLKSKGYEVDKNSLKFYRKFTQQGSAFTEETNVTRIELKAKKISS